MVHQLHDATTRSNDTLEDFQLLSGTSTTSVTTMTQKANGKQDKGRGEGFCKKFLQQKWKLHLK